MSDQNHFEEERIVSAVLAFVNAKTWAESKTIVQARYDNLLTPAAVKVFEVLLMQHKDDENAIRVLEDRRSLLLRCQSEGIDAAFADRLKARPMPDIPPDLLARLKAIRTDAELHELIEEHPELLPVIQQIVNQSQAPQWSSTDVSNPDDLFALLQELQELNRLSDMPRRVELCQRALGLVNQSAQPELWAGLQAELGNSLYKNPLGPRAENLESPIEHYNQALKVYTREAFPEKWAATQNNLANAYRDRIRGDRVENLELAIDHCNQALEVRTREAFPADWAMTQNNLAAAYRNRIRGERAENIDLAIDHYNQALEVSTREAVPENWAGTRNNLANAYWNRIRGERAENIDLAIDHYKQALKVYTREAFPANWAGTHNNLAAAYSDRIRGDRTENIELAIDHYKQALEVYTREAFPEQWAMTQNNLATAHSDRIRGERTENIDLAIDHYNQALEVRTREAFPEDWAATQNNLAAAYRDRIRGDRAGNLELAIEHYNQALEVRTYEEFPEQWAMTQNNIALAYSNRISGRRDENLELAIEHYNRALEVYTREAFPEKWAATQNNLANAYSDRIRGDRAENIDLAIEHFNQALEVRTLDRFPADHRQTRRNLGNLHFAEQSWEDALADYDGAIEAGNAVLAEAHTEVGRKAEVGETSRLYARSAYCLLKLEQIEKAVLRLEEGKTRLLTEALALADADLDMLSGTQRQEMLEARETVRLLEAEMRLSSGVPSRRSDVLLGDLLREKRTRLNELVGTLCSEHPDFMPKGLDMPGILGLIPVGGALVAPLVTSKGSAVFVIPHGADSVGTDHVVPLDSLTEDDVLELLQGSADDTNWGGWMGAYFAFRNERTNAAMGQWLEVIEESTGKLWTMLMGPVHQKLRDLNLTEAAPIILMPQGYLGLLPLHAAWRDMDGERRTFIDDYTVTYAPSAYSLSIIRGRMKDPSRQKHSLLAVINPTEDLRYTPVEGMAVKAMFDPGDRKTLLESKATKETVVNNVAGWTYLHFSCHGFYNWQDVMGSGLMLANHEILTLSEIISSLNLDTARLVTLSACETGMTDTRQSPDEFIGLPTGFLQAGAAGVVSTLWAVNDAATSLLIKHFYREHLKEGMLPDQALRSAQLWLRGATRQELGDTYNKFIDRMSHREAHHELVLGGDPGDKPYANPYYWAAFTFTGI